VDDHEFSTGTVLIVSAIVIIALIAGGVLLLETRPDPVAIAIHPPVPTPTPEPSPAPGPMLIYVTGAVANPQITVELPPGSRVQDALDAAGGVTDAADMDRVNVTGILHDGDQVHVYSIGGSSEVTLATPSGGELVYINTATLDQLDTLPGIGPAIAQRIIDYRTANGPFADYDALGEVNGIGPSILEDLQGLISFD
jgi:competence protein ComEA